MTDTEADRIITDTYAGPRSLPASWGPTKGCVRPAGLVALILAGTLAYLAGQGISIYRSLTGPYAAGKHWWSRR